MGHINFEFKAKTNDLAGLEKKLLALNPRFVGIDFQKDTYFNVPIGRLKLREGNVENALIFYQRKDSKDAKISDVILYPHEPKNELKEMLKKIHGIKVIVEKERRIYFIDNVKFHFDTIRGLGDFVEVEAIDLENNKDVEALKKQCDFYQNYFNIPHEDLISLSYSDML